MKHKSFWSKVTIGARHECWTWTAAKNNKGYGRFRPHLSPKEWLAHRFSYTIHKGPIPDGYIILHSCDNPLCVNPAHLIAGTHYDNNHDCIAKGRDRKNSPKGEKQYHSKMTGSQVIEMRRAYIKGEKLQSIQAKFGLSFRAMTQILYGEMWQHLLGVDGAPSLKELLAAKRLKPSAILNADDVREIRRLFANGETQTAIARRFGTTRSNVYCITHGRSWRDVD